MEGKAVGRIKTTERSTPTNATTANIFFTLEENLGTFFINQK